MSSIWAQLGIDATTEIPLIRKAYAEKLRSIDQDREPDLFMALRAAFTQALRQAQAPAAPPQTPPEPKAVPAAPPDFAQLRDEARIKMALDDFAKAEAAKAALPAYDAYKRLMALGAGGAHQGISPFTLRIGQLALRDASIPAPAVDRILHEIGLDAMALERHKNLSAVAEIQKLSNLRLAAESFMQSLETRAAQFRLWMLISGRARGQYQNIQTARFILGRRRRLFGLATAVLLRDIDRAAQHRLFLQSRLDYPRLEHARRLAAKFIYRKSPYFTRWITIALLVLASVVRAAWDTSPN